MLAVPGRPRDRVSSATSRLDQATLAIRVLVNVAEAASVIPGVRAAANLALNIADVAKKVKANHEDCIAVATRCNQLVMAVVEATQGQAGADINLRLKGDVQRFIVDLQEIQDIMIDQSSRSALTRILRHVGDMDNINKCKEMLDDCYRTFQIHSSIAIRLQLTKLAGSQSHSPAKPNRARIFLVNGPNPYSSFRNQSAHPIMYKGKRYPTGLHLFFALKFPPDIAEKIRTCGDNTEVATKIERSHASGIRADWDKICIQMGDLVLWYKFMQNPSLRQALLDTGDAEIINDSGNKFWGLGKKKNGRNELGKALERLRETLRHQ